MSIRDLCHILYANVKRELTRPCTLGKKIVRCTVSAPSSYRYSNQFRQPERRAPRSARSGGCLTFLTFVLFMIIFCPRGHAPAGYEFPCSNATTFVTSPSIRSVRFGRQRILRCRHLTTTGYKIFAGPEQRVPY